jgi:citrate lyase subunit beta/citryl-CoA lyase
MADFVKTTLADRIGRARSLLFVPGDRPERFDKADRSGADAVILDLEDAVAPDAKGGARGHAVAWLDAGHEAVVRINAPDTRWYDEDVAALAGRTCVVMLPKAEGVHLVLRLREALGAAARVVPLVETATGVLEARSLCGADGVVRVAFGSVDLASQLGVDPEHPPAMAWARATLVLASAESGLPAPIDSPSLDIETDSGRVRAEAAASAALGFGAKLCVHPHQVPVVNGAFTPSPEELSWARQVLAAEASGGVSTVQGRMVDRPVFVRARRLLERARESG